MPDVGSARGTRVEDTILKSRVQRERRCLGVDHVAGTDGAKVDVWARVRRARAEVGNGGHVVGMRREQMLEQPKECTLDPPTRRVAPVRTIDAFGGDENELYLLRRLHGTDGVVDVARRVEA